MFLVFFMLLENSCGRFCFFLGTLKELMQNDRESNPIFFKICMSSFYGHIRLSTKFEENQKGEAFAPFI